MLQLKVAALAVVPVRLKVNFPSCFVVDVCRVASMFVTSVGIDKVLLVLVAGDRIFPCCCVYFSRSCQYQLLLMLRLHQCLTI